MQQLNKKHKRPPNIIEKQASSTPAITEKALTLPSKLITKKEAHDIEILITNDTPFI